MTLALFDIDGTLVRGSTERRFWRYLLTRGRQGPRQILAYALFLLRFWPTYGVSIAKKNKAYLRNLATADVEALAAAFVATEVLPRLFTPAVQRLQQHLRRGDTVVLLSGTLEPIARTLADSLGVQKVCATVCSQRDGRYLARPPEVHPFGKAKLDLAAQLAAELGYELRHATAYGDSRHDLDLLRAVGEPVAVLPDASLSAAAATNDWEVIADDNARRPALPH
jgi:HAD superfamily hydrolase (TIGR01490 family)